ERWINAKEQDIPGIEAGVDIAKILKRSYQEAGADEDDHRKRHLHHHQRLSEREGPAGVTPARERRRIFLESRGEIQARAAKCRRKAEEDAGKNRHRKREREHAPVGL